MAVILYARVSTTKQVEKDLSIPDQLKQMRQWCNANGHSVAVEYVEPGASATDDRRPVFQKMISEALDSNHRYEAVIVHSLSRFFRDHLELGIYERRLNKAGVKLISITQQTTEDPAGNMARSMFALFDEYQSKENGKHTLRAMKENAEQGYFNGSTPPYGYKTVEAEAKGRKGKKKRLVVDEEEACIVRKIYDMYLDGINGLPQGIKAIATWLNEKGIFRREKHWTVNQVHRVLSNEVYIGNYVFNKKHPKEHRIKPESEWITVKVVPIILPERYALATANRTARSPGQTSPAIIASKTLLVGLIKCGHCGAGMSLMTGKGGRYRYYKCKTRMTKANNFCDCPNIRKESIEKAVIDVVADKICKPERLKVMLGKIAKRLQKEKRQSEHDTKKLGKDLTEIERNLERLYDAVANGNIPSDEFLKKKAHKLKARREAIELELAGKRRLTSIPSATLSERHLETFAKSIRKMFGKNQNYAKQYLKILVDEVRYKGKKIEISGSNAALTYLAGGGTNGHLRPLPSVIPNWLPGRDSNPRPSG